VYSTYLGGTTQDEVPGTHAGDVATGIAIDAAGNAYVTGYTSAYNFPVTSNAYQKVNKAGMPGGPGEVGNNAFATKLNPTGSALIYSTYFGGSGGFSENGNEFYGETPAGIAIDAAGNPYVAGSTGSPDLPITSNAFQKVNNAGSGAFNFFITKFNSTGSGLIYSTYPRRERSRRWPRDKRGHCRRNNHRPGGRCLCDRNSLFKKLSGDR
jgi:hypothetical protein